MKTESITDAVSAVQESRTRMVVVAYQPNCSLTDFDAAAESEGWAVLNVGAELATVLVDTPTSKRASATYEALNRLVDNEQAPVLALARVEILFDPTLQIRPLDLLRQLSRNKTLVVVWPGRFDGRTLTYAEPGWPEYATFDASDLSVVTLESATDL